METATVPALTGQESSALPPAVETRSGGIAWGSLLALAAGHFAVDCCTGIWPVFKTLAQLDIAKAGLIATAGSMAGNGLQLGFGVLADRGWRRQLLVGGVALAGAVTLLPWAVRSYALLFALVLIAHLASAAFHPTATGAAAGLSRTRTGFILALFLTGGYGGYALSQVLFSSVYRRSPTLTPLIAVVPLAAAAAIALRVPSPRARAAAPRVPWDALRAQVRPLAPLFAVQVFTNAINVSLIFLLPDLLFARHAPPWMVGGGGHFALIAGGCLSLVPAGHAADRWGARRVLLAANLSSGLLLATLLGRNSSSATDLALVLGFGAFNGMNNVVAVAEGNRMLPGQASGVSAVLMGLAWCLAAVGPVLAGVLADPSRGGTPAGALSWLAGAIPLALLASVGVRPRRR